VRPPRKIRPREVRYKLVGILYLCWRPFGTWADLRQWQDTVHWVIGAQDGSRFTSHIGQVLIPFGQISRHSGSDMTLNLWGER